MTTDTLNRDIAEAQRMYSDASLTGDRETWAEYEATVDLLAGRHGIDLRDAYTLVEEGPIIF